MSAVTTKIVALLKGVTRKEVEAMPPLRRRELADMCLYWANVADAQTLPKKLDGVLAGITRRDLDKLAPEQALALGTTLRRIADVAAPLPAPPKTTAELFEAARKACLQLRPKEGIVAQLERGQRAEDSDEVYCFRPWAARAVN